MLYKSLIILKEDSYPWKMLFAVLLYSQIPINLLIVTFYIVSRIYIVWTNIIPAMFLSFLDHTSCIEIVAHEMCQRFKFVLLKTHAF